VSRIRGATFLDKKIVASKVKSMKETKGKGNSILWIEAFGFSVLIMFSWLTEAIRIPHFIFGEPFAPNWHRAILRTVVILFDMGVGSFGDQTAAEAFALRYTAAGGVQAQRFKICHATLDLSEWCSGRDFARR
jgi:ABC-type Mn2+/Zn2+ transport system permease subunit